MVKVIAATVLAVGILAACGEGPTGPTATSGGEVELRVVWDYRWPVWNERHTGMAYWFVDRRKEEINTYEHIGTYSDIALWPAGNGGDCGIYAKPGRIYLGNGKLRCNSLFLCKGESVKFKLRTLDDKARCEVTIKNISTEKPEYGVVISKFIMRYKIEIY